MEKRPNENGTVRKTGRTPSQPNMKENTAVSMSGSSSSGSGRGKAASAAPAKRGNPQALQGRHAVRQPRYVEIRKEKKTPFPIAVVLFLVVVTLLFLFMMMNYAEIDKYNSAVTELQNEVATLQAEQKKLDLRLENKDDRTAFEKYAAEELGMVKSDSLSKYIVTLNPEDKTEIMEYDDGKESGFGYLLSGLAEVIRDFFS